MGKSLILPGTGAPVAVVQHTVFGGKPWAHPSLHIPWDGHYYPRENTAEGSLERTD